MHLTSAKSIWAIRIIWTIIALGIVIVLGRALPVGAAGLTPVFINEIHYDNDGADTGEAIEIAGPAGTDLAGWSLVLYNGSSTVRRVYSTTPLSGVLPDQQNGYGTLAFGYPSDGIQNGSPDGIALVAPDGSVIQFISYEGSFTAADGPANGMTSTDIGVSEPGSTPTGQSLQLAGTGSFDQEFSWQAAAANTFGAPNSGQTFVAFNGNIPPAVANMMPANGATGVEATANLVVEFNEAVQVQPSGFTFSCTSSGTPDLAVAWNDDNTVATLDPQVDLAAGETCTLTVNSDSVTDLAGTPLFRSVSASFTVSTFGVCGEAATLIHAIQGSGDASPMDGAAGVVIEGVVVGDYQEAHQFGGFYMQEEVAQADGDPATSEAIFVYDNNSGVVVGEGDVVRVEGVVDEFRGLTELTNLTRILHCGTGSVTPTPISLPQSTPGAFERYEGMLVTFEQPAGQELVISENYDLGRFGEIVLSAGDRLYQPTHLAAPGAPAQAIAAANALNRIYLDDANNRQNPDPVPYLPAGGTLRVGTTVTGVSGVLDYRFNVYRIQPTAGSNPVFVDTNPRPAQAPAVGGYVKVASANVLNYFITLDAIPGDSDDGDGPDDDPSDNICGPLEDQGCRGADFYAEHDELARQRAKILAMLAGLNADVVGLIEIENHPQDAALIELTNKLNELVGADAYAPILTGPAGGDAIRVALIYKPSVVTPVGGYQVLDSNDDARFIDTLNRPVLAQTFEENSTGERFTVAVAHLKSKGSACDDVGDPDTGDGQGNCNVTRTQAADALADWLATDPTGSGDPDFLIVGDLNAYAQEDPITTLEAAGFTNLLYLFNGDSAYSYVFDDQSGNLDHALGSAAVTGQVTGAAPWHINADEPRILDYNIEFKPGDQITSLYSPDAYRSSDHDPLLVGLCLNQLAALPTVSIAPASLWPPNHQMVEIVPTFNAVVGQVTGVTVTSSEPDNGLGDGDTPGDILIGEDYSVQLRGERAGSGPGRVYTLTYSVADRCDGAIREVTATVTVPASQGSSGGQDKAGVRAAAGEIEYRVYLPGMIR